MGLKNVVGLSLIVEKPVGISCLEKSDKHCHFISRAREGDSFYIRREAISCPLARFYLGIENDVKSLAKTLVEWDDSHDEDTAVRYLKSAPHLDNCPEYIAYFPYPHESLRPDVIIKIGSPSDIMSLVQRFSSLTGERVKSLISGIGASCGECTTYPIVTRRETISLGCYGSRPGMDLGDDELLLAFSSSSRMVETLKVK
jgi:uncharacterized protein (DUF169 family)